MTFSGNPIPWRSSFRFRLFGIFTLMTALVIVFFCSAYIITETRNERDHAAFACRLMAEQLAGNVRIFLFAENREALQLYAKDAARAADVHSVTMYGPDGSVLAEVRKPGVVQDPISQTVQVLTPSFGMSAEAALGLKEDTEIKLLGSVRIELSTEGVTRKVQHMAAVVVGAALVFWALVSILSYMALRRVTRSFNALTQGVRLMHAGDYTIRIDLEGEDEPGQVALAVNELAASLLRRETENAELHEALLNALRLEVESKEQVLTANRLLEEGIAERNLAEQAVRESERALKNLMDYMPVGVAWVGHDDYIEYLNHFFVERFGYDREEIRTIGDWFVHAFPDPVYRRQVQEQRSSALVQVAAGAVDGITYEGRVTCRDGAVRHVIFCNQITRNHTIDIITDITERTLLQEQFIRMQKLESLGVLASGIAHNFNNVLTGVIGYIAFACRFLDESHKARPLLSNAERAAKRAAGIAKQLLTFTQGGSAAKQPVSVSQLIDESLSLVVTGTCVNPRVELESSLQAVIADEVQLAQVFNSIIINAVQAMPAGGELTIRGGVVRLEAGNVLSLTPGDYVRLDFEDQGEGIPEEHHQKIFVPYFTTKAEVGTGLGLATAHSIVARHGGTITFASEAGRGTIFTIYLPSAGEALTELLSRETELFGTPSRFASS